MGLFPVRGSYVLFVCCVVGVVLSGCQPFTWTSRLQQPLFRAPASTKIALVSLDVSQVNMGQVPAEFRDVRKQLVGALQKAFRETNFELVDRVGAGMRMSFSPRRTWRARALGMTRTVQIEARDQPYFSSAPTVIPSQIKAPLLLGVHVLRWETNEVTKPNSVGTMRTSWMARTDIAYALWDRMGRQIESRRIRVSLLPRMIMNKAVSFVPPHSWWSGWSLSKEHSDMAPTSREHLIRNAIQINAHGFAWLFGKRKVRMTALWDDSNNFAKPGVEWVKEKQYMRAYQSWKDGLEQQPKSTALLFNLAVVCEILGKEKEAIGYYEKAFQIATKGYYKGRYKALLSRLKAHKTISLK